MDESGRLIRLEERYAHLQQHQREQDKAMLGLAEELARLRQEVSALRTIRHSPADPDRLSPEERPPHY